MPEKERGLEPESGRKLSLKLGGLLAPNCNSRFEGIEATALRKFVVCGYDFLP